MKRLSIPSFITIAVSTIAVLLAPNALAEQDAPEKRQIDQYSFRLGAAAAFAEMVRFGNKTLALSSAVLPEEMEELRDDLEKVIAEQGALATLEPDLIVTDLFPADIANKPFEEALPSVVHATTHMILLMSLPVAGLVIVFGGQQRRALRQIP